MHLRLSRAVRRWMAAERSDCPDEADLAFRRVFHSLPRRAPSPGFADRVLAAGGVAPLGLPAVGFRSAWARGVVAVGLALGALMAFCLPRIGASVVAGAIGGVAALTTRALAWLIQWSDTATELWTTAVEVGRITGLVLATPQAGGALLVNVLAATGALYGLTRLLATDRSRP